MILIILQRLHSPLSASATTTTMPTMIRLRLMPVSVAESSARTLTKTLLTLERVSVPLDLRRLVPLSKVMTSLVKVGLSNWATSLLEARTFTAFLSHRPLSKAKSTSPLLPLRFFFRHLFPTSSAWPRNPSSLFLAPQFKPFSPQVSIPLPMRRNLNYANFSKVPSTST